MTNFHHTGKAEMFAKINRHDDLVPLMYLMREGRVTRKFEMTFLQQGLKILKIPIVSKAMVNLIINIGKIRNL